MLFKSFTDAGTAITKQDQAFYIIYGRLHSYLKAFISIISDLKSYNKVINNPSKDLLRAAGCQSPLALDNIMARRLKVLEDSNLLDIIFSYLDPASVKEAAMVSR